MLTGAMLTYVARKYKHFAALPAAIAIIPVSFYLVVRALCCALCCAVYRDS